VCRVMKNHVCHISHIDTIFYIDRQLKFPAASSLCRHYILKSSILERRLKVSDVDCVIFCVSSNKSVVISSTFSVSLYLLNDICF
jgi:hypothetical protein